MKSHEIESWALRIIQRVEANHQKEDFLVELKKNWPDAQKAARQIAGHANAARGEPILWLIGVDENDGVTGALDQELASWWPQVRSEFNGVAPSFKVMVISWKTESVVALLFETDRRPFVIRNPLLAKQKGNIEFEVPWREGNTTRTATRNDLILLLSPIQRIPKIETLEAKLRLFQLTDRANNEKYQRWVFTTSLYITPHTESQITIPAHNCELSFTLFGGIQEIQFENVVFPIHVNPMFGEKIGSGGYIQGPGLLIVDASLECSQLEGVDETFTNIDASFSLKLYFAEIDESYTVTERLPMNPPREGEQLFWYLNNHPRKRPTIRA